MERTKAVVSKFSLVAARGNDTYFLARHGPVSCLTMLGRISSILLLNKNSWYVMLLYASMQYDYRRQWNRWAQQRRGISCDPILCRRISDVFLAAKYVSSVFFFRFMVRRCYRKIHMGHHAAGYRKKFILSRRATILSSPVLKKVRVAVFCNTRSPWVRHYTVGSRSDRIEPVKVTFLF